ncbi:hypothetical protein F4813DRAFT_353595 [Daldinia decipiens]|uniref:uncharacterized protein n=1 Tax=Daldinia decipiens TaxID=326647 RepID=UPI0020C263EB|nr:uncharacterized protein F4813DRAFT_353595 [Daldinia decipiens]KAI1659644.1 hypothetical protein F4813DRAFT_353595 [Daldinia decipiens]
MGTVYAQLSISFGFVMYTRCELFFFVFSSWLLGLASAFGGGGLLFFICMANGNLNTGSRIGRFLLFVFRWPWGLVHAYYLRYISFRGCIAFGPHIPGYLTVFLAALVWIRAGGVLSGCYFQSVVHRGWV